MLLLLTSYNSCHQGSDHQEDLAENQGTDVAVDFGGVISNTEVDESSQKS